MQLSNLIRPAYIIVPIFALLAGSVPLALQAQTSGGLADLFDPDNVVAGDWELSNGDLMVDGGSSSRLVVADEAPSSYSLTVEFTRLNGENSVGVILPVGASQCSFLMSVFDGEAHGIGVIDSKFARANVSTIKPGTLENDHPYRLLVEVEVQGDKASISSTLDGRPFLQWSGGIQSLSMFDQWKLPSKKNVGLIAYAETAFHRVTLAGLDPTMRMTQPVNSRVEPKDDSLAVVAYGLSHREAPIGVLNGIASESGFQVSECNDAISAKTLNGAQLLYLRAPKIRFSSQQAGAIGAFVRDGGSLLLVMDEERRTSLATTGANAIIKPFGLAFTEDTTYLHNCGAICNAGDIHKEDREVPFSGGRSVTGGKPFGFQLDPDGNPGQPFATALKVQGGGKIVLLGDGMAAGLMGTRDGERLSGVPRDPSKTTYWGRDSKVFLTEVIAWLLSKE